jgi:hypothetical protein
MIAVKKIDKETFELIVDEESEVFHSTESVVYEEEDFFEVWLTNTKYYTKEIIDKLLSYNWANVFKGKSNFRICFNTEILADNQMPSSIINWVEIQKKAGVNSVKLQSYSLDDIPYFWKEKYSAKLYFDLLLEKVNLIEGLQVGKEFTFVDDEKTYSLSFKVEVEEQNSIKKGFDSLYKKLENLHKISSSEIRGFKWKIEYEKDESYFSQDLLLPLFRKLGFKDVHYNHGRKEYGKDFVFSEVNKFGFEVYYGVQVKKGNMKGSVNSQIDEIIGQIEDAFSIPFYTLNSKEPKFISTFIVAISGRYSENAKEKIIRKISNRYGKIRGSIFFLDKEKLIELMAKE